MASMMISISRKLSSKFIRPSFSSCISSKFEGFAHYSNSKLTQRTQPLNPNFHFSSNASTIQKSKSFPQTLDLKLKQITLTNTHLKNQNSREFSTSGSSSEPDISALANEARVELKKMMKFIYDAGEFDALALSVSFLLMNLLGYIIITEGSLLEKSIFLYGWFFLNFLGILAILISDLGADYSPKHYKLMLEKIKTLVEEGREEDLADFLKQLKTSYLNVVKLRRAYLSIACVALGLLGAFLAYGYFYDSKSKV